MPPLLFSRWAQCTDSGVVIPQRVSQTLRVVNCSGCVKVRLLKLPPNYLTGLYRARVQCITTSVHCAAASPEAGLRVLHRHLRFRSHPCKKSSRPTDWRCQGRQGTANYSADSRRVSTQWLAVRFVVFILIDHPHDFRSAGFALLSFVNA